MELVRAFSTARALCDNLSLPGASTTEGLVPAGHLPAKRGGHGDSAGTRTLRGKRPFQRLIIPKGRRIFLLDGIFPGW